MLTEIDTDLLLAQGAAAVVIGANIGTTATALMTTPGATPNAHRAAWAHVTFNLLGVLLMWPLAERMTRALMQR